MKIKILIHSSSQCWYQRSHPELQEEFKISRSFIMKKQTWPNLTKLLENDVMLAIGGMPGTNNNGNDINKMENDILEGN